MAIILNPQCGTCGCGECCFYPMPPDAFVTSYPWPIAEAPAEVQLQGGEILTLDPTEPNITYLSSDGDTNLASVGEAVFGGWLLTNRSGTLEGYSVCLFASPYYQGDPTISTGSVYDTFSTTYSLATTASPPVSEGTLTRTVATDIATGTQGSCVWSGGGFILQYVTDPADPLNASYPNAFCWTLTDPSGDVYVQSGSGQSAVGTYGGYTVS